MRTFCRAVRTVVWRHTSGSFPSPMENQYPLTRRFVAAAAIVAMIFAQFSPLLLTRANAATLYWDSDGNAAGDNTSTGTGLGGTGTWDTSSLLWWDGSAASDVAWPNAGTDTAIFAGAGGMVSLGAPIAVGALQFNVAGFNITG